MLCTRCLLACMPLTRMHAVCAQRSHQRCLSLYLSFSLGLLHLHTGGAQDCGRARARPCWRPCARVSAHRSGSRPRCVAVAAITPPSPRWPRCFVHVLLACLALCLLACHARAMCLPPLAAASPTCKASSLRLIHRPTPALHPCRPSDDPGLTSWVKLPGSFLPPPPPSLGVTGWRDPFVLEQPCPAAGQQSKYWYVMVGAGLAGRGGTALVYRSMSLTAGAFAVRLARMCSGAGSHVLQQALRADQQRAPACSQTLHIARAL